MKKPQFEQYTLKDSQRFGKVAGFMRFFVAWNLAAVAVYFIMKKKKIDQNPEWNNLSGTQKILSFMHDPEKDTEMVRVKIDGVSSYSSERVKMSKLIEPIYEPAEVTRKREQIDREQAEAEK